MIPLSEGGGDEIENAIPVCFECHAEIHSYNPRHPRGRMFTANELRKHKEQWLVTCQQRPGQLLGSIRESDVGPLQALIDELNFNQAVVTAEGAGDIGCPFQQTQFLRAIQYGSIAILKDEVRDSILDAYRTIGSATEFIKAVPAQAVTRGQGNARTEARRRILDAGSKIKTAKDALLRFLGHDH